MKIKICGITNLDDANAAAEEGADEIGFNFYAASPRYIAPDAAVRIASQLPPEIKLVGVFVNEDPLAISEIAAQMALDAVQLHGDETGAICNEVRRQARVRVIKAVRGTGKPDLKKIEEYEADAILVDSFVEGRFGGSGKRFDWRSARPIFERFGDVYAAGGLDPSNVADAITELDPSAVDVCSGGETRPGLKDPEKLRAFFANARAAGGR